MSKFIDYEPLHEDEIDYNKCKWLINEVCCNSDSDYCADYPSNCTKENHCKHFEQEDRK